jgi:acetyltransferase
MTVRLEKMFRPRSVAVVGADNQPQRLGSVVMRNLLAGGFEGPIMPVNPNPEIVAGMLTYPDIASLPLVPDLRSSAHRLPRSQTSSISSVGAARLR